MPGTDTNAEKLAKLLASAATDPMRARMLATRQSRSLAPADAVLFFEQACRSLAAAIQPEVAQHCFTLARKADQGLSGVTRLHPVFLEFAAVGVVAPTVYRDYAKQLAIEVPAAEAHSKYREVVCTALDAGFIPSANLFADLRTLAKAAGSTRRAEDDYLAEYLLRSGMLAGAPYRIWNAAENGLARVARRDRDLMGLLIAAEPDSGLEQGEHNRLTWLSILCAAGAGAVLAPQWFFTEARGIPIGTLRRLAGQADARLFPSSPSVQTYDPALFGPTEGPTRLRYDETEWYRPAFDWKALADSLSPADSTRWNRFASVTAEFVTSLDYEGYRAALPGLLSAPHPVPDLLKEAVTRWTGLAATGGLADLDEALTHLVPLAANGFAELHPAFVSMLRFADPADALVTALQTGLPAELGTPGFGDHLRSADRYGRRCWIVQDGDRLTYMPEQGQDALVFGPDGLTHRIRMSYRTGEAFVCWHDGADLLLSEPHQNLWRTYLYQGLDSNGGVVAVVDERRRSTGPASPSSIDLVFPGADRPTRIDCADGRLRLHAAGGGITSSYPFGTVQDLSSGRRPTLPPGWMEHQRPVDPAGSRALRRVGRDTANLLIEAGLQGPATVAERMRGLIPEVTDPGLKAAVAETAVVATRCLLARLAISGVLDVTRPRTVPKILEPSAGLPLTRNTEMVSVFRMIASFVREAAEEPRQDQLQRIHTLELPRVSRQAAFHFGSLGSLALLAATEQEEFQSRRLLDILSSSVDSPLSDGSGRWRMVMLEADDRRLSHHSTDAPSLWRTPSGAALLILRESIDDPVMIEYSPDGTFTPIAPPEWHVRGEPVPQGWGTPDRVAEFRRLLATKGGIPIRPELAWDLAAKTGISPQDASRVCFGSTEYAELVDDPSRYPPELVAAAAGGKGSPVLPSGAAEFLRERLMPDDPAELWLTGPDVDAAAAWWQTCAFRRERL